MDVFDGFLIASNTSGYDESNMIENSSTTDYCEERRELLDPLGACLGQLGGLGRLWVSLRASWEPLEVILEPLRRVWGALGLVSWG